MFAVWLVSAPQARRGYYNSCIFHRVIPVSHSCPHFLLAKSWSPTSPSAHPPHRLNLQISLIGVEVCSHLAFCVCVRDFLSCVLCPLLPELYDSNWGSNWNRARWAVDLRVSISSFWFVLAACSCASQRQKCSGTFVCACLWLIRRKFSDEIHKGLKHTGAGILSMANRFDETSTERERVGTHTPQARAPGKLSRKQHTENPVGHTCTKSSART